jgi:sporulation protein YlmC with PRC-barrel domain
MIFSRFSSRRYEMKAKELIGKEVLDAEARKVGKVVDFDVDIPEAQINSIEVKAGLMKGFIINLDKIHLVGDKIILKVKESEL